MTRLIAFTVAGALLCVPATGLSADAFSEAQVQTGADIYERNCSPCHGPRMLDPQSAFNLRNFPRDQHDRFVSSVTRGKNQMPPWGDMLKPDDIEALWAYVVAGEKQSN
jgi:mono/diheme cytochrome c family protein